MIRHDDRIKSPALDAYVRKHRGEQNKMSSNGQMIKTIMALRLELRQTKERIVEANKILDEFPKQFPLNPNKKGDIEIWKFDELKGIIERVQKCISQEETKEVKQL